MGGGEGGGEDGGEGGRVWQGEGEEGSCSGARVAGDSSVSSQWLLADSERLGVIVVGSASRFHRLKMSHGWFAWRTRGSGG